MCLVFFQPHILGDSFLIDRLKILPLMWSYSVSRSILVRTHLKDNPLKEKLQETKTDTPSS